MKIRAKFKGKDGSLGYRTGRNYTLNFGLSVPYNSTKSCIEISVFNNNEWDRNTTCRYSSLKKFLENWDVI